MSAATDSLNFAYSLAVERLTTPAGAAAEAIGRVNKVLAASQKLLEKLEERLPKVGERLQSFSQAANTGFLRAELAATRFTATTQKIEGVLSRIKDAAGGTGSALAQMTSRAERAVRSANAAPDNRRRYEIWWEQQAARMEKAEQKKTAALERDRAVALVAMAWCSERVRRASELASALGHGPLADAVRHALGARGRTGGADRPAAARSRGQRGPARRALARGGLRAAPAQGARAGGVTPGRTDAATRLTAAAMDPSPP